MADHPGGHSTGKSGGFITTGRGLVSGRSPGDSKALVAGKKTAPDSGKPNEQFDFGGKANLTTTSDPDSGKPVANKSGT